MVKEEGDSHVGIKFGIIKKNGGIITRHVTYDSTIENLIKQHKDFYNWRGGKFEFIRISSEAGGKYKEIFIDHTIYDHLLD